MSSQIIIGLECHVQLNTDSKLFCSCTTKYGGEPNSACCPVCLGMPGSKPVLNKKALDYALKVALALNCRINEKFFFSRKTYFYPDMSKNFQITQYEIPVGEKGFVQLQSGKKIGIARIHLEEDPAALVHESGMHSSNYCLVDYNRSGIPLIEVVTEPDIASPQEAREFLDQLTTILCYLDVFDFEAGTLKADCNLSIKGNERVEIKNVTGKRNVEKALDFEAKRQAEAISTGKAIVRETRAFDEAKQITRSLRKKETEADYGYVFDADLTAFEISENELEKIREELPELHTDKAKRLVQEFGITEYDAKVISSDKFLSELFEEFAKNVSPKTATFAVSGISSIAHYENKEVEEIADKIKVPELTALSRLLESGKINEKIFKEAAIAHVTLGKNPVEFVKKNNLFKDLDESNLKASVEKVVAANKSAFDDYKSGNEKALNFIVGLVMRETKGKADARAVKKLLEEM
ncbi:MAG: Asp-tRNA(Asn)/Glu-tRNA(Gln) amidotransferase subunit GatB [Candidatus Diapherotrites archaeon]|nr:Asp-tRNA(Asn)/Glu-tRNA(Gln) amidotransferase subunit GatB [Candidatus Diapherotrites archaeon]